MVDISVWYFVKPSFLSFELACKCYLISLYDFNVSWRFSYVALELIGFWKSENGRLNLLLSYSCTVHLNVAIFL